MAILRVKEAFAVTDTDGAALVFAPGDLVDDSNKWVKNRETMFESVEAGAERKTRRSVERATAVPEEKRDLTTPKKSAAKKAAAKDEGAGSD